MSSFTLKIYGLFGGDWKCLAITKEGWGVGLKLMWACKARYGEREYECRHVNEKVDKLKVDNG